MKHATPANLALGAAIVLVVSMIFSPFLLSVGMWGLVAAALWEARLRTPEHSWLGTLRFSVGQLTAQRGYWATTLLFWVFAVSVLWSSDVFFWLERVRIRLPFLVLPWAFANLPRLALRQYASVVYVLVVVLVLFSAGSLLNFRLDSETILAGLGEGQPVPVPRNHIRFSLIMVIALTAGGWLLGKRAYWSHAWERRLFGAGLVFLFVAIHIFSVRSALVALYAVMLFSTFRFLMETKRWAISLVAVAFMAAVPVVAYMSMDSIRQRIGYMLYDWQHFRSSGGGESYSDSERFVSLDIGYHIWRDNKILGVGIGDLEQATLEKTIERHPIYAETPKLPHNQFLYTMAATGLFGLSLSALAFALPLFDRRYRGFYLFMAFQIIVSISFLVEYTLETSIGAAFFLFYQLWWMRMGEALADDNTP